MSINGHGQGHRFQAMKTTSNKGGGGGTSKGPKEDTNNSIEMTSFHNISTNSDEKNDYD